MNRKNNYQWCGSADHPMSPNRREFLTVGALGGMGLGLTLGDLLTSEAQAELPKNMGAADWKDVAKPSKPGKAKNIIQIHLPGGSAHQETFDPKYLAPQE